MNINLLQGVFVFLVLLAVAVMHPACAFAQDGDARFRATQLPLPRFVSIAVSEVNVRAGPGLRYPIKWIFKRKDLPVEIVQEFDHWRKIRDHAGDEGWVHKSLLSGRRTLLVQGQEMTEMYDRAGENARVVAKLEPGAIVRLSKCNTDICAVEKDAYRGWVQRNLLWGIYEHEFLN